jgi:hypothetical protein
MKFKLHRMSHFSLLTSNVGSFKDHFYFMIFDVLLKPAHRDHYDLRSSSQDCSRDFFGTIPVASFAVFIAVSFAIMTVQFSVRVYRSSGECQTFSFKGSGTLARDVLSEWKASVAESAHKYWLCSGTEILSKRMRLLDIIPWFHIQEYISSKTHLSFDVDLSVVIQLLPLCKTCGYQARSSCQCGVPYCSRACQQQDWPHHRKTTHESW